MLRSLKRVYCWVNGHVWANARKVVMVPNSQHILYRQVNVCARCGKELGHE